MTPNTTGGDAPKTLPARASLEHLRKEAKARLAAIRATNPATRLAEAQFAVARDYGFSSWRALKAEVERRAAPEPVGDWIGLPWEWLDVGLHIRRREDGGLKGTIDVPGRGYFDDPLDGLVCEGGRLRFQVLLRSLNILYDAEWDAETQRWTGEWVQAGKRFPLIFTRGELPPWPTVRGLDGIWDGRLEVRGGMRLSFALRSDEHGTRGWFDSPDGAGMGFSLSSIHREGDAVELALKGYRLTGRVDERAQVIDGEWISEKGRYPIRLTLRPPGAPPPGPLVAEAQG